MVDPRILLTKHRSRLHGIIVVCIFRLPPPSNLSAVGCTKTWDSLCLRPLHYQVCSGRPPLKPPRRASTLCIAAAAFSLRIRLHGPAFCNTRENEAGRMNCPASRFGSYLFSTNLHPFTCATCPARPNLPQNKALLDCSPLLLDRRSGQHGSHPQETVEASYALFGKGKSPRCYRRTSQARISHGEQADKRSWHKSQQCCHIRMMQPPKGTRATAPAICLHASMHARNKVHDLCRNAQLAAASAMQQHDQGAALRQEVLLTNSCALAVLCCRGHGVVFGGRQGAAALVCRRHPRSRSHQFLLRSGTNCHTQLCSTSILGILS